MPPRQERELDPVTLHNQALVSLAGGGQEGAAGMDRLRHLLAHPPFPPELAGNLLSLCCRPVGGAGISGSGGGGGGLASAAERAAVAEQLLQEHGALVAAHVPADLLPLYEACVAGAHSIEEAHAKLDALAGVHIEGLRRRVKAVQDARWAGDQAAAAAGLEEYETAVEAYVPGGR
jgi:tetratricopeptide repeat protein 30